MALRSRDIDRLLDMGLQPVSKVPHVRGDRPAAVNLGKHPFTHPHRSDPSDVGVVAVDGTPAITLTDGDGNTYYQPLQRLQARRKTNKKGRVIVYTKWEIPDRPLTPPQLVGATTWIRHNSTPPRTPHQHASHSGVASDTRKRPRL